ncbi:hypothetical protein ACOME3_003977 [Neoechinorhynchus agilis]
MKPVALQPLFYALRPILLCPKPILWLELLNALVQLAFDYAVFRLLGLKALLYLLCGTILGLGLHPISGHFLSEHYQFFPGIETCSYYGWLNYITFNVGYHMEHHDFPNVPCYYLPKVKAIAPEFYDNLPCHYSWTKVIYDFIMRDDMGPATRIRRKTKYDQVKKLWTKEAGYIW